MNVRVKITEKMVSGISPDKRIRKLIWDSEVPGLALRRSQSSPSFVFIKCFEGVHSTVTLGKYPKLSLQEARDMSKEILTGMACGVSPKRMKEIIIGKRRQEQLKKRQELLMSSHGLPASKCKICGNEVGDFYISLSPEICYRCFICFVSEISSGRSREKIKTTENFLIFLSRWISLVIQYYISRGKLRPLMTSKKDLACWASYKSRIINDT